MNQIDELEAILAEQEDAAAEDAAMPPAMKPGGKKKGKKRPASQNPGNWINAHAPAIKPDWAPPWADNRGLLPMKPPGKR